MLNFLMVVHGHQPVGNFERVIEEAFAKSYSPFVEVLKRHPSIKLSLHFSGNLLDWFKLRHPDYIATLKGLVKSGQIEIFSGGFYEPILTLIPEKDAREQIELLSDSIEKTFAYQPAGGWIAERVWEPKLPQILSTSGLEYGVIDDTHFSFTGKLAENGKSAVNTDDLSGYYLTEEAGHRFAIFPGSEKLRYYMPFKLPQETINYFQSRMYRQEGATISFGDDIEKFGLWPGTHQWVYKENWLENFFTALEQNSSWLKTLTFKEYYSSHQPSGRVYLSCASYREMQEWSLGFYRNFLVKYPEANNMHKKMFYLSGKVREKEATLKRKSGDLEKAKQHVFMSQANDAYWHGVFGGLYLYHLRSSIYANMIEAEKFLDRLGQVKKAAEVETLDFDFDGKKEIIINTETLNLQLRPEEGAALSGLDYKPKSCNLIDTLNRKPEPYHQKLRQVMEEKKAKSGAGAGSQPTSIHDTFQVKEEGLDNLLFYDRFPRYSWLEHFLPVDTTYEDLLKCRYFENGDFIDGAYRCQIKEKGKEAQVLFTKNGLVGGQAANLSKSFETRGAGFNAGYTLKNLDKGKNLEVIFGVEYNLSVSDPALAGKKAIAGLHQLDINDSWHNLKLHFSWEGKTDLWVVPVETISESESGIEKTYQELCCFFFWRLNLAPLAVWQNSLQLSIG
jgi:4-alpha-glucanotransferase